MNSKNLSKKLTVILLVAISVAIIVAVFVGVYVRKYNKIVDITPDATYSSEVSGSIEYRLSVDETEEEIEVYVDDDGNVVGYVDDGSDTSDDDWENTTGYVIETQTIKTNDDEILTEENYEKTKSIIEARLEALGATEYQIRLNTETGDITVDLSENDSVSYLYQTAILSKGEFRIIDYQTGVVLLDGSNVVEASEYTYSSDGLTYDTYLQIEFDEEGANIINEISQKYIEYTDDDGEEQIDYITIEIDGDAIYTTYFGEEYTESVISIPLGQDLTDTETIEAYEESVEAVATIINLGELPITYTADETSGLLVRTNISDEVLLGIKIAIIIVLIIITIIFIVRYKLDGLLAGIFNAAFVGLVILVLSALNIVMSSGSLFAIIGLILLNILFLEKCLNAVKENISYLEVLKSFYGVAFPVIIVAFVFTMITVNTSITGIGMTLFWGLILEILFNTLITRTVFYVKSKLE